MCPLVIVKKVLVVEDVAQMRELLGQVISRAGGLVVSGLAASAMEARQLVFRERPDLVVLDEILPGESSVDFLTEMNTLGIPVLMITGIEDAAHEVPAGACGRLMKPSWNSMEEDRIRFGAAIQAVFQG
ncbi:MAG: hypothetical protein A2583_01160 [Bdellovibrionales bacterium RIFOXYD1_FULL_53_11]|nr:MAG: hypothetical protein A2583_01160 [Bdellovibrionales bacterium RIFOXYD1_FULL_53_11]